MPPLRQHVTRRCARRCVLWMSGMPSRAIAEKLNEFGIEAPRGGAWAHKSVLRMMARLGLKSRA
jgi:Recombinase